MRGELAQNTNECNFQYGCKHTKNIDHTINTQSLGRYPINEKESLAWF